MAWLLTAAIGLSFLFQSESQKAGVKAIEEQRYADAVEQLKKAAAAEPKNAHTHFYLAYALGMLRQDEAAIAAYTKALELQPEFPQARLNFGIVLLRQKRAAEAVQVLEPALRNKPKDYATNYAFAEALLASGKVAEAVDRYNAALESDPKSAAAESGLGRALAQSGKLKEADPHYRRAAELDPAHAEALLELASLYEQGKMAAEAIALYEKFPSHPVARERLGELLLEGGNAEKAIPHLEAAVSSAPTSGNRYALAMAYVTQKEYQKAEALFEQALKAEPGNVQLQMNYARVLREQKKLEPAARAFLRAAELAPNSPEPWSDLAGMLILMGQEQQALAALDRVRSLGAEKAAHHYFRAIVYDKNKMHKEALDSYEKFLSLSDGKNQDEEFKARQRVRILTKEVKR